MRGRRAGTDVKPLECLLFMRDVKSRNYFEQMKGRGTRTLDMDDLLGSTLDSALRIFDLDVGYVALRDRATGALCAEMDRCQSRAAPAT